MATTTQNASVMDGLKTGVQFLLDRTGQNAAEVQAGLTEFWSQVQPDVDQLMADAASGQSAAAESLELLADAAVARATRLSLAFTSQERAALGAVLMTGLKTAVGLAAAAALA